MLIDQRTHLSESDELRVVCVSCPRNHDFKNEALIIGLSMNIVRPQCLLATLDLRLPRFQSTVKLMVSVNQHLSKPPWLKSFHVAPLVGHIERMTRRAISLSAFV